MTFHPSRTPVASLLPAPSIVYFVLATLKLVSNGHLPPSRARGWARLSGRKVTPLLGHVPVRVLRGQMHVFIHLLDAVGVGAGVVGEFDAGTATEFLFLIIDMREVDGQIAGLCDGMVTGFPLVDSLACAFRTDDKDDFFVCAVHFVNDFHQHLLRFSWPRARGRC